MRAAGRDESSRGGSRICRGWDFDDDKDLGIFSEFFFLFLVILVNFFFFLFWNVFSGSLTNASSYKMVTFAIAGFSFFFFFFLVFTSVSL